MNFDLEKSILLELSNSHDDTLISSKSKMDIWIKIELKWPTR